MSDKIGRLYPRNDLRVSILDVPLIDLVVFDKSYELVARWYDGGIVTVGDLASKSDEECFDAYGASPRQRAKFKSLLSNYGF